MSDQDGVAHAPLTSFTPVILNCGAVSVSVHRITNVNATLSTFVIYGIYCQNPIFHRRFICQRRKMNPEIVFFCALTLPCKRKQKKSLL